MPEIHLVRHGRAAAGFGTHKDPGLDDLGKRQASAVAAMLEPLGPLPVWSSPLARAFETAAPLAALWRTEIRIEPRIAEIPSPTDDLAARARWLGDAMQGNWSDLAAEFQAWRRALLDCLLQIDRDSVMFSHYVAINAAVGAARQDDRMRVFAPDNGSITTMDNSGGVLSVAALGRTANTKIN